MMVIYFLYCIASGATVGLLVPWGSPAFFPALIAIALFNGLLGGLLSR